MFPISLVAQCLGWLILATSALTLTLQAFVFIRRRNRAHYFLRKDAARQRHAAQLEAYLAGKLALSTLLPVLLPLETEAERDAVSELAGRDRSPEVALRRSRLLWRTGHVHTWAVEAFGAKCGLRLVDAAFRDKDRVEVEPANRFWRHRHFRGRSALAVPRALALYELGRLAPEHANVFLAHALHDPAVVVRRLAIESMGENHSSQSVPLLLEELRRAVEEGNDVSLRTIKSALVRFHISDMEPFLPFFTHPTQRMRFFVIDTLREICHRVSRGHLLGKDAFSPEMRKVVVEDCCGDEFADVRARAAGVLRHFLDAEAVRALHKLLQDDNEFVRLHAVRACAHSFYRPLIPDLLLRVTDVRWRVREAAVRSLIALTPQGLDELYHFFISSRDKYACEQISEELQCRGLVRALVHDLASSSASALLSLAVCRKMVLLGYTSMLIAELGKVTRPELQISFTEALRMARDEDLVAVLREVSQPHPEAEHQGLLQLLYRPASPELAAQGSM